MLTLSCTPYVQLVVSAALMRLPAHAEEAAQTLGAPPSKVFWQVVFPALRPALGFAALLVVVYAAADFGAVAVMDVPVLTYELYQFAGNGGIQAPLIELVLIRTSMPMIVLGRRLSSDQSRTQLSYEAYRYRGRRPAPRWGQLVGTVLAALPPLWFGASSVAGRLLGADLTAARHSARTDHHHADRRDTRRRHELCSVGSRQFWSAPSRSDQRSRRSPPSAAASRA